MTLYDQGQHEVLKATTHGAMLPLLGLALVYNLGVCRYRERVEWWHVANVAVYGLGLIWEITQVARHIHRERSALS